MPTLIKPSQALRVIDQAFSRSIDQAFSRGLAITRFTYTTIARVHTPTTTIIT